MHVQRHVLSFDIMHVQILIQQNILGAVKFHAG